MRCFGLKKIIFKGIEVSSEKGDLTQTKADALVNPANSRGEMGGGVAGALKKVGGERVEKDAIAAAPIKVGKAVATSAGSLKARFVIHAPTMTLPAEGESMHPMMFRSVDFPLPDGPMRHTRSPAEMSMLISIRAGASVLSRR